MKFFFSKINKTIGIDNDFVSDYDVSIVPQNVDLVVWDDELKEGLLYFNEFAMIDGFLPGPQKFTTPGVYAAGIQFAKDRFNAVLNPKFYYCIENHRSDKGFDFTVGDVFMDDNYPQLTSPPDKFTDVPPPNTTFTKDDRGVSVPDQIYQGTQGLTRYLQYHNGEWHLAGFDVSRSLEAGKEQLQHFIRVQIAQRINRELSMYSMLELSKAADISALKPTYERYNTIKDYLMVLENAIDPVISQIEASNSFDALKLIEPTLPDNL